MKYDTKRTGFIRKTITVTSNATNAKNGVSYLKIKGEVKKVDNSSILEKKKKNEIYNESIIILILIKKSSISSI